MNIRLVDSEAEFDGLEEEWNRLADKTSASIFSSFDYARLAWKHFHKFTDRLFILVFSNESSVVGIAPLCIIRSRKRGIPCRVVRFIAAWEGDRPRILAEAGSEAEIWGRLFRFLEKDFTNWEILDLIEQSVDGLPGCGWTFLPRSAWYWESQPDTVGYYISLQGTWDDYLGALGSKTRGNWRRQTRRLSTILGGYTIDRALHPSETPDALRRFIAIEQSSWKAGTAVGVAKDERHKEFYEDLLFRFAGKKQVVFHFLTNRQLDVAGSVCFLSKDVIYGRHTAYLPTYAEGSPGMVLHAEIMREGFEGPFREFDLLGIQADGSAHSYKTHWATGKRETIHWTGHRVRSRLLPAIAAKRLKRLLVGKSVDAPVSIPAASPEAE